MAPRTDAIPPTGTASGPTQATMSRRAAVLAVLSLPLGSWRAFAANAGWLKVDLGQWAGITVTHKGKTVILRAEDIFAALQEK